VDAGTLRLGKILRGLHVTNSNGCVSVNLYRRTVGKNDVVEGYLRSPRGREIATENPPRRFFRGAVETEETCPSIVEPSGIARVTPA